MVLKPPVEPMLAQARESIPGPGVLPGGLAFEAKFDGYRALLFTSARPGGPVLLQSRRSSLIQRHFPDLVAAAEQLPDGLVLDGELVVGSDERLSFEALQRRAVSGGRTVSQLAAAMPWMLCPMTTDPAAAQEWLESWTEAPGAEGLVIKGLGQGYMSRARSWSIDCTNSVIGSPRRGAEPKIAACHVRPSGFIGT